MNLELPDLRMKLIAILMILKTLDEDTWEKLKDCDKFMLKDNIPEIERLRSGGDLFKVVDRLNLSNILSP